MYKETGEWTIGLNIVIQVVGSRGDVQPFIGLGAELQRHGHRVRLATHGQFDQFVRKAGLEFFDIGGDPEALMAFMVNSPGLIPGIKSIRDGDIQGKRRMVAEMLQGCWRSCIEPDERTGKPFVADAIIANPPSFAHIHCAQALGVPVHLMFTMPWTPTTRFCHPLANLQRSSESDMSASAANWVSYIVVEWMTWQGLGDVVNAWRDSIDLAPVPFSEGPGLATTLKVPFTYCWSPSLVPKPDDWSENIDVCGFFYRDAPNYTPDQDLDEFLRAGPPPIYIGFGSIVIDNPAEATKTILSAVKATGVRAIVSRGWSKLGSDDAVGSRDIFYLGDCPHEWLFQHVAAVIHHGGAGTTACGLLNGRPSCVIPFFGDQFFWGSRIHASGAGPAPIPFKRLDQHNLADAIRFCLTPEALEAAQKIAGRMSGEAGVRRAVASFHANLPLERMRCDMLPNQAATWTLDVHGRKLKLSKIAAEILAEKQKIPWSKFKIYQPHVIHVENQRWDPVTASLSSLAITGANMVQSASNIVIKPIQALRPVSARSPSSTSSTPNSTVNLTTNEDVIYGRPAGLVLPPPPTTHSSSNDSQHGALAAITGSASGVGGFLKHYSKGMLLDLPYAFTEGMRNAPKLYGGEVYQPGPVTDWKSGGIAAGKNFAHGIVEGIGGVVLTPIRGVQKEGALGAAKGVGIGLLNLGTKISSGAVGLVALPGQGLYQSARTLVRRSTTRAIVEARQREGHYAVTTAGEEESKHYEITVLGAFGELGQ
jgi:UDP:flavonoid glycosyltransferase YjiC (YdhE family)